MPRVHIRTRKRAVVKRPMRCSAYPCKHDDPEIKVGDSYYTWAIKSSYGGTVYFRHVDCGYPRPTQLSNRKTAQVEEAVQDANWPVNPSLPDDWDGSTDSLGSVCEEFVADCKAVLEEIGSVGRDVGQEYQSSFDAMPEGLNQGETAQAMEQVAQDLEYWADELDSWDPNVEEPDWPERDDVPEEGDEQSQDATYREMVEQALDGWADDVRSEAEDKLGEMPEYQG